MHSWNKKGGALWVTQKRGQLGEGRKENLKRRNGRQAISDTNGSERKLGPTNVHRIPFFLRICRVVCDKVLFQYCV